MKKCFDLLRNVLLDAFNISAMYFTPPYEDFSKIDLGLRASVWTDYNDENSKVQLADADRQENRLLIIRSNLGFYNIIIFWTNSESLDFISIGPFRNDELSPNYFTQILKEAHITPAAIHQMKHLYENMPFAQVDAVVNVSKHIVESYIPDFKDTIPELIEYADHRRPIEIHTDVIEKNFIVFSEQYAEIFSDFLKYLKCGDNANARKTLQAFIYETKLSTKRTLRNYKSLLTMLNDICFMALLQTSIHPSHILMQASSIATRIDNTTSLSKLDQMSNDICHKYCLLVRNYANSDYSKITRDIIAYIRFHLDEELSLARIAEHFDKNPSVISNIFSKETGQTLTSFVQQTRIQEAIRLFNTTNMSVSEVSVAIGYQDFSYFSKVFSKIVGVSPRKYKLQNISK